MPAPDKAERRDKARAKRHPVHGRSFVVAAANAILKRAKGKGKGKKK